MQAPSQVSPFVALKRAHLATRGLLDRALSTVGVSLAQFGVLRLLDDEPGMSGAELARRSSVTPPTMNEIIGGLERTGLIARDPAPEGRGLLAHLTPAGHATIRRCLPVIEAARSALFDALHPAHLAIAMSVLEATAAAADDIDESTLS